MRETICLFLHSTEIKKIMIEIKVSRNYEIPDERWMIVVFFLYDSYTDTSFIFVDRGWLHGSTFL